MVDRIRLLLACSLALFGGCKPLDVSPANKWFNSSEEKPMAPSTVTAVWSTAVLQRADSSRARGFGGRIMFYGPDGQKPIRVDGSLAVYGFDEDSRNPQDPRPDRKYLFTREQLASHYSKSELGHSYSIWIPWETVDGPPRQVSLLVRFNPTEGSPIAGELARLSLPGSELPEFASQPAPRQSPPADVRQASHQAWDGSGNSGPFPGNDFRRMATATIPIPPRGGR